jgi:hypothetical protein
MMTSPIWRDAPGDAAKPNMGMTPEMMNSTIWGVAQTMPLEAEYGHDARMMNKAQQGGSGDKNGSRQVCCG